MEVHDLTYPDRVTIERVIPISLAIGFFDGLHKGHQQVIQTAIRTAKQLQIQSAVMTFNPHPSHLFAKEEQRVGYITPFEEKVRLLNEMGVDHLFVVTFDWALAALSPQQFIDVFLMGLHVQHVTAGFDFTFGAKGAGTMAWMAEYAKGKFGTTIIEKVADDHEKISSTRIRQLLEAGEVSRAAQLLDRPFRTIGTVVHGDKRGGGKLGFPTANVQPIEQSVLPGNGVYAVRSIVRNTVVNGVCNVGVKPTFFDESRWQRSIEVHLLDFHDDIYGEKIKIDWVERVRSEQKFDEVSALIRQIEQDKQTAIQILTES